MRDEKHSIISNIKEINIKQDDDGSYTMYVIGDISKPNSSEKLENCELTANNVKVSDLTLVADVNKIDYTPKIHRFIIEPVISLYPYDSETGERALCEIKQLRDEKVGRV